MISDSGLEFNSLQPSSAESAEVRVPFRPISARSVKSNVCVDKNMARKASSNATLPTIV